MKMNENYNTKVVEMSIDDIILVLAGADALIRSSNTAIYIDQIIKDIKKDNEDNLERTIEVHFREELNNEN